MQENNKNLLTLTEVSKIARKSIKGFGVFLVFLVFSKFIFAGIKVFVNQIKLKQQEKPTVGFGVLSPISFPEQTDKPKVYTLQIATGHFPNVPTKMKVFLLQKAKRSILNEDKAFNIAKNLGFNADPMTVTPDYIQWKKNDMFDYNLIVYLDNLNSKISSKYFDAIQNMSFSDPLSDSEAFKTVLNFAKKAYQIPEDLKNGDYFVQNYNIETGKLEKAISKSTTYIQEVNIRRQKIDRRYTVYTPNNKGLIRGLIVLLNDFSKPIVEFEYGYQVCLYDQFETYPLRSPKDAWEILKSGEGYILQGQDLDEVVVRKIKLGYFEDPFKEEDYLMPVYVFIGDDDFIGLVSAIAPQWIKADNLSEPNGQIDENQNTQNTDVNVKDQTKN